MELTMNEKVLEIYKTNTGYYFKPITEMASYDILTMMIRHILEVYPEYKSGLQKLIEDTK